MTITNESRSLDMSDVNAEREQCHMFHSRVVDSFPVFPTPATVEADRPIVRTLKHIRITEMNVET